MTILSMQIRRVLLLIVAIGTLTGGGALAGVGLAAGEVATADERPAEPSTTETIGYVDGYWYDDELSVDNQPGVELTEDELESVVNRSMARVEELRELTFEEDVPVEVISRAEFQDDSDSLFGEATTDEQMASSITLEALFMLDRETAYESEIEALFGEAVLGYYDPAAEEVVLVADDPSGTEVNEAILGHELLHALQDQHFDLGSYDRETTDQDAALDGLVEGDAIWIERTYEEYCESEWSCVQPAGPPEIPDDINWGLNLMLSQPYEDGLGYVDWLRDGSDGWEAVNAAYDDPPASSSEVIRPGTDREPTDLSVEDRSSDEWEPIERNGQPATDRLGEVGKVSMLAAGAMEDGESVIESDEFFSSLDASFEFDQPYTDGWAGDELKPYVGSDVDIDDESAVREASGFVWESEWTSPTHAESFLAGYAQQLDIEGAEAVDDVQDTYVIDDGQPGAYYVAQDDEFVTIVRAPHVDDLDAIREGAAPSGANQLELADVSPTEASEDEGDAIGGGTLTGLGSIGLAAVVIVGTGLAILVRRRR